MSIIVMSLVWELDLPSKEKLLLLCLADFADETGGSVWPSVATMSRKTSVPERTLQRLLGSLRDKGVLRATRPANGVRTVHYQLDLDGLPRVVQPDYSQCPVSLRAEVIEGFAHTCVYCRQGGTEALGPDGTAWQVDRIVPGSKGGGYEAYNVTLSCGPCNRKKRDSIRYVDSLGVVLDRGANLAPSYGGESGVPNRAIRGATHGTQGVPDNGTRTTIEPSGTTIVPVGTRTLNQRGNDLAKAYCDLQPLSNFPAVAGICRKALKAGYADVAIQDALQRLANEGRGVTTETLRVELEGLPERKVKVPDRGAEILQQAYEEGQRAGA
jgi:5-methylcytosine-specific restriction endonuclease McrA